MPCQSPIFEASYFRHYLFHCIRILGLGIFTFSVDLH